jgi:hypothetical protein
MANKMEAWRESGTIITLEKAEELLKSSCHGSTEHSVIFQPLKTGALVSISVADGRWSLWSAPYNQWKTFPFHSFFQKNQMA